MLEARLKRGKRNDLYFEVTDDFPHNSHLTLNMNTIISIGQQEFNALRVYRV